jgi:isocitrate dehydrogenase
MNDVSHHSVDNTIVPVTVAHGDGIGPVIMSATVRVLTAAGARLEFEDIEVGQGVYPRRLAS